MAERNPLNYFSFRHREASSLCRSTRWVILPSSPRATAGQRYRSFSRGSSSCATMNERSKMRGRGAHGSRERRGEAAPRRRKRQNFAGSSRRNHEGAAPRGNREGHYARKTRKSARGARPHVHQAGADSFGSVRHASPGILQCAANLAFFHHA